ncbi:MAG: hypothetical protein KDD67_02930 [Ignavibacteriae bacterium]|nr:hypothetical protein [Ignavibacteriota bacterium]MCB9216995.1 hypothetical protein [Ignavibacteria bacterium]
MAFFRQDIICSFFFLTLVPLVGSCAAGDSGGSDGKEEGGSVGGRVALVEVLSHDSAKAAQPTILDGMLRQAFDSIPDVSYVTFSERGTKIPGSDSGVSVADLAKQLDLAQVLSIRVARFGSVVGADLRSVEPASGKLLFHDRAFSFIRYRDQEDNLLFGPALYEAVERLVWRMGKRPDSEHLVVSAEPLVVGSVVIARDPALGKIEKDRVEISKNGVRALGDFARVSFPEFVVFDYESRSRLYETVGLAAVEDHEPVGNLERSALFKLDIPYMLSASITPGTNDSVRFRVEFYRVTGNQSDTLLDFEEQQMEIKLFNTATTERDAVGLLLELAKNLLTRQAGDIRSRYATNRLGA